MSDDVYLVKLMGIKVVENGKIKKKVGGANILEAKLIYPKEGIPALTTIRHLSLQDNQLKDCSGLPMKENVLFKQSFDGDSVLEFNICAEVRYVSLERGILKLLGIVAKSALTNIPGLGAIATAAISSVTDSIFSFTPKKTVVIGSVAVPIQKGFTCQNKMFQLKVPEDAEIVKMRKKYPSNEIIFDKLELSSGQPNGEIFIDIVKL